MEEHIQIPYVVSKLMEQYLINRSSVSPVFIILLMQKASVLFLVKMLIVETIVSNHTHWTVIMLLM